MKSPIFISYATPAYHEELEKLEHTLRQWFGSVKFYTERLETLGSWQANTQRKNRFISECLQKFRRPVVWVDADARVVARPTLLLEMPPSIDLAFHRRTDRIGMKIGKHPMGELLSGTLYAALDRDWVTF